MTKPGRNPHRAYTEDEREIAPMTLGNMRGLGVARVFATCKASGCGHEADLDVSALPDELPVPEVALHLRCSACTASRIAVLTKSRR
jgi:hypothetical protein